MGFGLQSATVVSLGVAVAAIIVAIWSLVSTKNIKGRLQRALSFDQNSTAEDTLVHLLDTVESWSQREQRLDQRLDELEKRREFAFDHLGLVRYNAFDDTGAELSFSLALMTDTGDGVVLTSLWGREEVRVYAKPLEGLNSRLALSSEEKQAVDLARSQRH